MTVEHDKLIDALKNEESFRSKIEGEVRNFESLKDKHGVKDALLMHIVDGANGSFANMLKDVGIKKEELDFMTMEDYFAMRDRLIPKPQFLDLKYHKNGFKPYVDMSDYEEYPTTWSPEK